MNKILAAIFMVMLASCVGGNGINNKNKQPQTNVSAFNKSLANEYKNFSDTAWNDGMWMDSRLFKNKSAKAALGEEVLPENINKWKISEPELRNLLWANSRLGSFMVDAVKENYPDQLAHSQMLFDCWIERAAKKMKKDKIEECRMDFVLETSSLENFLMPVVSSSVADEKTEADYNKIVYFKFNKDDVNAEGIQAIDSIINTIKDMDNYKLKIVGYTDNSGDKKYNEKLSDRRVKAVVKHLIDRGVNKESIEESFGGIDNKAEKSANRRVEISVESVK